MATDEDQQTSPAEVDRTLPADDVAEMVRLVRPEWAVAESRQLLSGWTTLYHLICTTPDGPAECVLKATPSPEEACGIDAEARIHAVVAEQTPIPVAEILGVVDDHDDYRTPFFLMQYVPGETIRMANLAGVSEDLMRTVAYDTGIYLAHLHEIEVPFDRFGKGVHYHPDTRLGGGIPSGDPSRLVGPDPGFECWRHQIHDWVEEDLERHENSRFGDLTPVLRPALEARVEALPTGLEPVLGRVDHGWFNLRVDRDTQELSALLDWGSRFAVPRAFDLTFIELLLAGGWWLALPEIPDRRELVREALVAGYETITPVPNELDTHRTCYHLGELIRYMTVLEDRATLSGRSIPPDRIEEAATRYRDAVKTYL